MSERSNISGTDEKTRVEERRNRRRERERYDQNKQTKYETSARGESREHRGDQPHRINRSKYTNFRF